MSEFERKPDGGLSAWIETYEAMGVGENDAEMLCMLLELRRRRENQAEVERERDELRSSKDWYEEAAKGLNSRLLKAEAELARRNAAAREPVAWRYAYLPNVGDESGWKYVESEELCNKSSGYVVQPLWNAAGEQP